MPKFFVKYHELDSTTVIHMGDKLYRNPKYVRAVDAPDEATIRQKSSLLSRNNFAVEIDEISLMTAEQERVFPEQLEL